MPPRISLSDQLDELETNQIISSDTAAKIREYYKAKINTGRSFPALTAILGSVLTASGLTLVIAHNWDEFSPALRTLIAIMPMALAQLLCIYVYFRKQSEKTWTESAAIFLFFSVCCCIAMLSQIYQISGTISGFLRTWILLCFPLIYLFRSVIVMMFTIACITWLACITGYSNEPTVPYLYLLLMAAMTPFYLQLRQANDSAIPFLHALIAISFVITLGSFNNGIESIQVIATSYVLLFQGLIVFHSSFGKKQLSKNPAWIIGSLGLIIMLYMYSYEEIWNNLRDRRVSVGNLLSSPLSWFSAAMVIISFAKIRKEWKKTASPDPSQLVPWLLVALIWLPFSNGIAGFIVNMLIFLSGVYYIRLGSERNHLGILNAGLILITILALLRYFDTNIPFLWRGIFFVSAGILLFTANLLFLKKRRQIRQTIKP